MYSAPILLNSDNAPVQLVRIGVGSGFDEAWLQQRLFENPYALPISEIDPGYQQIAPLCTELKTAAGPADIVYVTEQGRLVVVETKLWRNPDARRKVVGQILDYAKELIDWDYADLQREVSRRTGIKGNSPYDIARKYFPNLDEARFVDGVASSLARGDFMLIIAGDGIRHGVQSIINFLENTAHMRFTLALLEVGVYRHPESDLKVIQPRVLAKTETIEKTYNASAQPIEHADELEESVTADWRIHYQRYWEHLLSQLQLDDPSQPIAKPTKLGNIYFILPPGNGNSWLTAYFSKSDKEIGCMARFSDTPQGRELFEALCEDKDNILEELPDGTKWKDLKVIFSKPVGAQDEWPPQGTEIDTFFHTTINTFINVFRPRLDRLVDQ